MHRRQTSVIDLNICDVETQRNHPELFHYTSRAAFESIVTSSTLWASHYADMADKKEVLLMRDRLPAVIAPRYDQIMASFNRHDRRHFRSTGGSVKLATDLVDELYRPTFLSNTGATAVDAFTVSFSTHANDSETEREHGLASQWKDYAGPDGFCLVFDTTRIADNLGQEKDSRYWTWLQLKPVRYGENAAFARSLVGDVPVTCSDCPL